MAKRSLNVCDAIALLMAALSLSMIGRGTPAGAMTPLQVGAAEPGAPASATAGKPGKPGERRAPLTASARTAPDRACGAIEFKLSNIKCTRPAIRSLIAAAPPR